MHIFLGSLDPYQSHEYLIEEMNLWCSTLDKQLAKEYNPYNYSSIYISLFKKRICTYEEYLYLFQAIDPKEYHTYPAYEYLQIDDPSQKGVTLNSYSPDRESYAQFVKAHSCPELDFFLLRHKDKMKYAMPYHDLKMHAYVVGATGSGKSTLLNSKAVQIIDDYKAGLVVIDPHAELVKNIRRWVNIKKERVIYFDPDFASRKTPIYNPFQIQDRSEESINAVAQMMTNIFSQVTDTDTSGNMKIILLPCIYTLLLKGDSSFVELQRFMDDDRNDDLVELGKNSPIPEHRSFFQNFKSPRLNPTKNALYLKTQTLLSCPEFKRTTTGKSTFNFEEALNQQKVILFNLSAYEVEALEMFGRLLTAELFRLARKRRRIEPEMRPTTFAIIDEFQNFVSESTIKILDQARKWGMHMILANQYAHQLRETKESVFANTCIKINGFTDSMETIGLMTDVLGVSTEALRNLKNFEFFAKSRGKKVIKFASNANYVFDTKYHLMEEEQKEFDDYQVYQYYVEYTSNERLSNDNDKSSDDQGVGSDDILPIDINDL